MSNIGGCPFGMVLWANSLMEFFFFDSDCSGKVTGSKKGGGGGRNSCRGG